MCSRLWNVTLIAIKYGFNRQKYWFETQLKTPHQDVCCFFKCHVYPSFFLDLDDLLKMRSTHHETELEGQWLVIAQRQHHMPIQTQDDEDASTSEPSGPMMQTQRMQPWSLVPGRWWNQFQSQKGPVRALLASFCHCLKVTPYLEMVEFLRQVQPTILRL